MNTDRAIQLAGSASALAKLLGITDSAISQWGECVPTARVWQLQVLRPTWFAEASPTRDRAAAEFLAQGGHP